MFSPLAQVSGLFFFAAGPPQGKNGPLGGQRPTQRQSVGAFLPVKWFLAAY